MIREKNIFIVGIKGVAMANLALILKKMGKNVSGSDVKEEFITDELLKKENIKFSIGFDPGDIPNITDLIIYSAAHQGLNNPQVREGIKRGLRVVSQAECLGEIMASFGRSVGVCGCHGKTTTSSLLAYSLIKLNRKPSYLVGVTYFNDFPGSDFQNSSYFVAEADEYAVSPPVNKTPKFFFLNPKWVIATNVDFDHPDVYSNFDQVKEAFYQFFKDKNLILNFDNLALREFYFKEKIKKNHPVLLSYGFSNGADYQIIHWRTEKTGSVFTLRDNFRKRDVGDFKISLFGEHNVLNATAVIVQLLVFGLSPLKIRKAMGDFQGAKRRLEMVLSKKNFILLDDYAHHPTEIAATIGAARLRYPGKKILVIFQPHTFSRTRRFFSQFISSLSKADKAIVLDIFPSAREKKENFSLSSYQLVKVGNKMGKDNLIYLKKENLETFVKPFMKENFVIITMGAGDVYKLKEIFYN